MKLIARFIRILLKLFEVLPLIGNQIRVININQKINTLETQNKFQEARKVREQALLEIPSRYHGPLLRSEGEDKLYRLKDYKGALKAFEKAILKIDQSPSLGGVTSPDRVYAGAAQAAIYLNNKEKALKYYFQFADLIKFLNKDPKLKPSLAWHKETLDWLNHHIKEMS